jgi:hypothetical protein
MDISDCPQNLIEAPFMSSAILTELIIGKGCQSLKHWKPYHPTKYVLFAKH